MYEIMAIRHIKILIPLLTLGVFILMLGCLLGFAAFPNKIASQVRENVVLEENTLQWYRFRESSFPFKYSLHFFSVENACDVGNGSKPIVKERGPYVYKERRVKEITNIKRDAVNYNEIWSFEFDKEASGSNTDDDKLLMINAPLMTLLQSLEDLPFPLPYPVDEIISDVFEQTNMFVRYKIKDLAFEGIKMCDPKRSTTGWSKFICLMTMLLQQKFIQYQDDRSMLFSLFRYKTQPDGPFSLRRGIDDINKLGLITEYKDKEYTSYWKGKNTECDKVEGHYTTFPPFMEKDTVWQVYSTDICKTGLLHYTGESSFKDVDGYRFATNAESFSSPQQECVCINVTRGLDGKSHCFSKGVLDLNNCFHGVPVVLSFPHLMWADEEYQNSVLGLKSDYREKYNVVIDFEPTIGFPLKGAIRIQFNMILRPVDYPTMGYFPDTEKLPRAMLPMLWIEDSFELTDSLIDELNSKLLNILVIMEGVKWGLIAVGIFLIVVATGFCIFFKTRGQ